MPNISEAYQRTPILVLTYISMQDVYIKGVYDVARSRINMGE